VRVPGAAPVRRARRRQADRLLLGDAGRHGGHGGGGGGGGGKANAPENIRLQGAVDFEGQRPPTLKNEKDIQEVIGSVSAASPAWQHLIGHKFTVTNLTKTTGKLEIEL